MPVMVFLDGGSVVEFGDELQLLIPGITANSLR